MWSRPPPHPLPPYPSNRDVPWFQIWEMKPHMGSTGLPPTPLPFTPGPPPYPIPQKVGTLLRETPRAGARRVIGDRVKLKATSKLPFSYHSN